MPGQLQYIIIVLLLSWRINAQETRVLPVKFRLEFNKEVFALGKKYTTQTNGNIIVEIFRVYVSQLSFWDKGKEVYTDKSSYYLLDAAKPETLLRSVTIPGNIVFDEVHFYFGIDPIINSQGIGEGDLDPANDMYWTWHTGYINMKIEGTFGPRNVPFQYHLGGFTEPYVSSSPVFLKVKATDSLNISADIGMFLSTINISSMPMLMSPGVKSKELSVVAAKIFTTE